MGYGSTGNFDVIEELLKPGRSTRGASGAYRICELGDQTIHVSKESAEALYAFADRNHTPNSAVSLAELRHQLEAHIGKQMHVRNVFRAAGFDYVSVDVNEEGGAKFVDLNYWPNEAASLGKFDVVTNFGTTEHIANQASAFATVHHMLSPGGVAIHHVPMVHYLNHALVNLTPRFLLSLSALNDYTIMSTCVQSHCIEQALEFHYGTDILFMQGIRDTLMDSTLATMAYIVIRKNSDMPFIPPIDVGADLDRFRRLLVRGMDHYNPGISDAQKETAIRKAMDRVNAKSCLEMISGTIDTRWYDRRLAMTGQELGQPINHRTMPAAEDISARANRKAGWMIKKARAYLAPTIIGRIKRKLIRPR